MTTPAANGSEIHFRRVAGGRFVMTAEQFLPRPRDEVFEFFSDAFQLEALTPPLLQFKVITPRPITMGPGLVIDYRLKLHGIPLRWQSLIESWEPPVRFVDLQTRGPYRYWHHEHVFEAVAGGTLVRDTVTYAVPGGWLIERLFVRPDLVKIFSFRRAVLEQMFAEVSSSISSPVR